MQYLRLIPPYTGDRFIASTEVVFRFFFTRLATFDPKPECGSRTLCPLRLSPHFAVVQMASVFSHVCDEPLSFRFFHGKLSLADKPTDGAQDCTPGIVASGPSEWSFINASYFYTTSNFCH